MEYMSVKGSVELKENVLMDGLTSDVLDRLEGVRFLNDDGIVTSKIKNDRLWILGEGLMQGAEANRLIGIVKQLYGYSDSRCIIDVQRIRWELNIVISSDYTSPEPNSEEMNSEEMNSEEMNSEEMNSEEMNSEEIVLQEAS